MNEHAVEDARNWRCQNQANFVVSREPIEARGSEHESSQVDYDAMLAAYGESVRRGAYETLASALRKGNPVVAEAIVAWWKGPST